MSLITDKVKMFALHGVGLTTGETNKKGLSTTRIIQVDLKDKRFKTAVMEKLEAEGFIRTVKDLKEIEKIVDKAIAEEKEISGIKIKE
jgi:hypothetical protein